MLQISTLEQLLNHAVLVAKNDSSWENVELLPDCATISLRVCGPGWDKKIDARGAKLIIALQKNIDRLFEAYPNQLPAKAPLVKVEAREGSNDLWILLEPFIREVIDKLSPEQVLSIIKYGMLCGTGLWAYFRTIRSIREDRDSERAAKFQLNGVEQNSKQQLKTLEVLEKAIEKINKVVPQDEPIEQEFSQPVKEYTRQLSSDDYVSFAQTPPIEVEEAKSIFRTKRRPRSRTRWVACDDAYICSGLNLEYPQPRLEIEQDGIKIAAFIERLTQPEKEELLNKIDQRIEKHQVPFHLNIKLNVYFNNTGIKHASVVGIGSIRENIKIHRLEDIPLNVKDAFDEFSTLE